MDTVALRQAFKVALSNDQKVDKAEFDKIKVALTAQQAPLPEESKSFLMDSLAQGQLTKDAIPAVIELLAPKPVAEPKKEEPIEPWKKEFVVQGGFNHVSVTQGWAQYGTETSATKIEGSFQTKVDYEGPKFAWKNKLLVEYGRAFGSNVAQAITKDNLEFTTEVAHKLMEKDHFKVEVPYMALFTKGPMTKVEERSYRETTGAKVTYSPPKVGEYALKVGGGLQQSKDKATGQWVNEPGVEVIAEVKQKLEFLQKPLAAAFDTKAETVGFVNRVEATASVNAFNNLQKGVALENTDTTIRTSLRYYLSDSKSVWVAAGKQWEYGGKPESTWESKFTADLGFKF